MVIPNAKLHTYLSFNRQQMRAKNANAMHVLYRKASIMKEISEISDMQWRTRILLLLINVPYVFYAN
jgi:hypothetical protein